MVNDFENIVRSIPKGYKPTQEELLPYLTLENKEERAYINYKLGEAYFLTGAPSLFTTAEVFAKRACLLSYYDDKCTKLYINILRNLDKTDGIKEVYKRIGLQHLNNSNLKDALHYFNMWLYTYAYEKNIDQYTYDYDILNAIDNYTNEYRKNFSRSLKLNVDEKIRIGYLVKDITTLNSVLVKINLIFARFHDQSIFEINWYVPETEADVLASPQGEEMLIKLQDTGCKIFFAEENESYEDQLVSVAQKIFDNKTQLLITSAALSYFNHYFITSMKPAPVMIGLLQGPPQQFIPPILDWAIAWTYHPLIDSPVNTSYVQLEMPLIEIDTEKLLSKKDFDLDADIIVLMSGGRHVKFQDKAYWERIVNILKKYNNVVYKVVGPQKEQIPFFDELADDQVLSRIEFLGWQEDYLEIANIADIILDTYPSGGGVYLLDVMRLAKPVITFVNDYFKEFSQVEWSPISEFANIPSLTIKRGNYSEFENKISYLVENKEIRERAGLLYKKLVESNVSNPERMVKKCEEIFLNLLLKNKSSEKYSNAEMDIRI